MKTLEQLLIELGACPDAIQWLQDRTTKEAVVECERADWILWLAGKVECDRRKLVLCGGLCANTVRHLMTDERSTKSVDTAIAYGQYKVTDKELNAAKDAAWAAAKDGAWAAVTGARAASKDDAWAAAWAAAEVMTEDAALKEMADIVKPIIADELIHKVNNLLQ